MAVSIPSKYAVDSPSWCKRAEHGVSKPSISCVAQEQATTYASSSSTTTQQHTTTFTSQTPNNSYISSNHQAVSQTPLYLGQSQNLLYQQQIIPQQPYEAQQAQVLNRRRFCSKAQSHSLLEIIICSIRSSPMKYNNRKCSNHRKPYSQPQSPVQPRQIICNISSSHTKHINRRCFNHRKLRSRPHLRYRPRTIICSISNSQCSSNKYSISKCNSSQS